jgi:hypothetical protein
MVCELIVASVCICTCKIFCFCFAITADPTHQLSPLILINRCRIQEFNWELEKDEKAEEVDSDLAPKSRGFFGIKPRTLELTIGWSGSISKYRKRNLRLRAPAK